MSQSSPGLQEDGLAELTIVIFVAASAGWMAYFHGDIFGGFQSHGGTPKNMLVYREKRVMNGYCMVIIWLMMVKNGNSWDFP